MKRLTLFSVTWGVLLLLTAAVVAVQHTLPWSMATAVVVILALDLAESSMQHWTALRDATARLTRLEDEAKAMNGEVVAMALLAGEVKSLKDRLVLLENRTQPRMAR